MSKITSPQINAPSGVGIGLKAQHFQAIIDQQPDIGFLEIHPENYMAEGGLSHRYLESLRNLYPLSMHGVGLSLGRSDGLSIEHLKRLKTLCERYQPNLVSEHLSWSHLDQTFFNDLLPLPYTGETLELVCRNIEHMQSFLGRTILLENPSTYIAFKNNEYSESEFLNLIAQHTGCGLLLDINNVFVSATNNGFDPYGYLDKINTEAVQEVHLAGHTVTTLSNGKTLRIDDHGSPVKKDVWQLYKYFLKQADRRIATLIEWDTDVPELLELLEQAQKATDCMREIQARP